MPDTSNNNNTTNGCPDQDSDFSTGGRNLVMETDPFILLPPQNYKENWDEAKEGG